MKLFPVLICALFLIHVECAVTANFISDPRSMFPKVIRTRNAVHFLQFYMSTFKQMFRKSTVDHFNYYDDQVKGNDCYTEEMDYGSLKRYFERYSTTHTAPQIRPNFAVVTKDGMHMYVEFHVETMTWLGMQHHFHFIISAFNDETVGWGVRYLRMDIDC